MKKIFAMAFVASLLITTGCKKDEGDDITTCRKPEITVDVSLPGEASVYMDDAPNAGFYELEYGPNGFSQGSGITLDGSSGVNIANLNNGTYDIYVRANCGGSEYSEWVLKSFIINGGGSSTCNAPSGFYSEWNGTRYIVHWSYSGTGGNIPGYFQVEYGITGFTKGTGTLSNASSNYFPGNFTQGETYDVYVRSNCGGSDFSTWSGPFSFYAQY